MLAKYSGASHNELADLTPKRRNTVLETLLSLLLAAAARGGSDKMRPGKCERLGRPNSVDHAVKNWVHGVLGKMC